MEMTGRLPDFLGIGCQKGGTTTLFQMLRKEENIWMPDCKEIHFFDKKYQRGIEWYRLQFTKAKRQQKCGEITPFYLFHPEVAKRIKRHMPNIKLIILLRDPAKRAISQYHHAVRKGFETLELKKALEAEEERMKSGNELVFQRNSYVARSRYEQQLIRYEKMFDPGQIKIIKSESFFNDKGKSYGIILNHLGVIKREDKINIPVENSKNGDEAAVNTECINMLEEKLRETRRITKERYGICWD